MNWLDDQAVHEGNHSPTHGIMPAMAARPVHPGPRACLSGSLRLSLLLVFGSLASCSSSAFLTPSLIKRLMSSDRLKLFGII